MRTKFEEKEGNEKGRGRRRERGRGREGTVGSQHRLD
jgi:hypothetical protein